MAARSGSADASATHSARRCGCGVGGHRGDHELGEFVDGRTRPDDVGVAAADADHRCCVERRRGRRRRATRRPPARAMSSAPMTVTDEMVGATAATTRAASMRSAPSASAAAASRTQQAIPNERLPESMTVTGTSTWRAAMRALSQVPDQVRPTWIDRISVAPARGEAAIAVDEVAGGRLRGRDRRRRAVGPEAVEGVGVEVDALAVLGAIDGDPDRDAARRRVRRRVRRAAGRSSR